MGRGIRIHRKADGCGRQGVILAVYLFIFGLATAYLGSYYTTTVPLGLEVGRC